jgi:hypothetical protein
VAAPFHFVENEHQQRRQHRPSIVHIHVSEDGRHDGAEERTPLRPRRSMSHPSRPELPTSRGLQ